MCHSCAIRDEYRFLQNGLIAIWQCSTKRNFALLIGLLGRTTKIFFEKMLQ